MAAGVSNTQGVVHVRNTTRTPFRIGRNKLQADTKRLHAERFVGIPPMNVRLEGQDKAGVVPIPTDIWDELVKNKNVQKLLDEQKLIVTN